MCTHIVLYAAKIHKLHMTVGPQILPFFEFNPAKYTVPCNNHFN